MKFVDQTILHTEDGPKGNCFAACLASLLGIPIEEQPAWNDYKPCEWYLAWVDWCRDMGWMIWVHGENSEPDCYYMATGKSPRGDFKHATIYYDGKLAHDPHPSRDGLERVERVYVLVPIDPSICLIQDKPEVP